MSIREAFPGRADPRRVKNLIRQQSPSVMRSWMKHESEISAASGTFGPTACAVSEGQEQRFLAVCRP
jgi:hypothetical protein